MTISYYSKIKIQTIKKYCRQYVKTNMNKIIFLITLLCISTNNTDYQKDVNLQELVLELSKTSSISQIKNIVTNNYCLSKSVFMNEPYFECSLTSRFLKGYKASKLFSVVENYYIEETSGEKYDEFLLVLGGYGQNKTKKNRTKRRIKLESDFKALRKMLENDLVKIGYNYRKGGESPEIETVRYRLKELGDSGFIKIHKYKGGCFNQALITIGFYKLMNSNLRQNRR